MKTPDDELVRERLLDEIRSAFAGVVLGDGTSLSQSEVTDNYGREITDEGFGSGRELSAEEYADLRHRDLTDDWAAIPHIDLDRIAIPFMDAQAIRYYLPALMVSALVRGEPSDMAWISLTAFLTNPGDRAALLNERQVGAVTHFIRDLPEAMDLNDAGEKWLRVAAERWG